MTPRLRLWMVGLAWVVLPLWTTLTAQPASTSSPTAAGPLQGAGLLKTDILGVFAHPDDEVGAAGTLATYALGQGLAVTCVYVTRGEGGGNMVGTQSGAALGILREAELRACLTRLGVRDAHFLERADFAYTESLAVTLEKWGHDSTLERLVRLVRALRPEVILTMNPSPQPGQHGNHQAAGLLAVEAFRAAADPRRFPDQLRREGLTVWQPRKLYYGGPAGTGATVTTDRVLADGRTPGQIAGEALANHRSQGFGGFAQSPWIRRPQSWTLVQSVVPFATDETNLFRGLPVEGLTPPPIVPPGETAAEPEFTLGFVPRPAVDFYRSWVRAQGIRHVAAAFVTDVPVVAGESNEVVLTAVNASTSGVNATVRFEPPSGWKVDFDEVQARFSAGRTNWMRVWVTPPAGRPADAEIRASAAVPTGVVAGTARLHPVPRLQVPKLTSTLRLDAPDGDPGWGALPGHDIGIGDTWQGTVTNAADCSAQFRMSHDGTNLWVEVRVRDDRVVSNLEPDDIQGHWRTDAVELCLDPAPGSEHTLKAFKLGIIPFDRTGRVRAARDADARPGRVEETSPGTRLASLRTADGYWVRAMIPLDEAGFVPTAQSRRMGWNVLIYDGDKVDAAPGENINRARLAWSPRPGVQGRPEDWGRADLE